MDDNYFFLFMLRCKQRVMKGVEFECEIEILLSY